MPPKKPVNPTTLAAAISAVSEAMDTGKMTLDEIFAKVADVSLAVKVPPVYAAALDVFARQAGISRHEVHQRLLFDGIARMVQTQQLPQLPEAA